MSLFSAHRAILLQVPGARKTGPTFTAADDTEVAADVPELPEVETLRRGLERDVLGRRISDVVVANAKVLKGQSPEELRNRITPSRIVDVRRRGKYLLIKLTQNQAETPSLTGAISRIDDDPATGSPSILLCIHLKMRGQLFLEKADEPAGRYHCVSLILEGDAENGKPQQALRFYDMWTWGEMRALTEAELEDAVPSLAEMGPEPLEPDWNGTVLATQLAKRRTAIKPTLLDQRVVAGVGNIYADESLFRAGIHPERPGASLSAEEIERLAQTIRTVLSEAVAGGGTASDDYFDLEGAAGRYVPKVYDRGGEPCPVCETVLTRIRLGGRGTVYCARCQQNVP